MTSSKAGGEMIFDIRKAKEPYRLKPHPVTGRLIDSHPGVRTKPMRVLCLGMPRTGTMSLYKALQTLGYTPYHMSVAVMSPKTSLDTWREAFEAKYNGKGEKWGRAEFDKLLGDYDAVADTPCVCFAEELIEAYPDAKVVLTTRDVDSWLRSMESTAGTLFKWRGWETIAPWDREVAWPFWQFAKVLMPAFFNTFSNFGPESGGREAFLRQYELVREVTPAEKMLEYQVGQGWQPLCEFLEIPKPDDTEFPRVNDAKQFLFAHSVMWWLAVGKMVTKIGLAIALPVGGVVIATMWNRGILGH